MNREKAHELLKKYVKDYKLLKHSYAVEAAMRSYAEYYNEDIERWGQVGLLHDIDYEIHKDEHPNHAEEFLNEFYDQQFIDDIISHGFNVNIKRNSKIRKVLHAVDEMSGFIVAIAMVRPNNFDDLKAKSVKKKMKDKRFAQAVNREELKKSCENLNIDFKDHIEIIVKGLKKQEEKLNEEGKSLLT